MTNARLCLAAMSLSVMFAGGCALSHTIDGEDAGRPSRDAAFFSDARTDGGSPPRFCGGFGGFECGPRELCDFPDGSFCGGDDSGGVCIPIPEACLEPVGPPVCGCDGRDYLGECAAHFAGTDVARLGECAPPSELREVSARRTCGPDDGPGWSLTLTSTRTSCDDDVYPRLTIDVWRDLDRSPGDERIPLEPGSFENGQAYYCEAPGAPCVQASGSITVRFFASGEIARFDYELVTAEGLGMAGSELEIIRWWCELGGPGCG